MGTFLTYLPDLALAYFAYLIATISPGPANLAIIAYSMRDGRRAGLFLASGVVLGSLTWGILAALGLSALLSSYGELVSAMRIAGGIYLLWLAYKSMRSAIRPQVAVRIEDCKAHSAARYFAVGLAIHLTNPKSIFAWLAIIAIGVGPGAPAWISFLIVAGCWLMGIVVFGGCALAFSTDRMVAAYGSFKRWIEGATALVFGLAGLKLLSTAE